MSPIGLIGNLSVDRVAGGEPRPGGGVFHAARAAARLGTDVVVVTRPPWPARLAHDEIPLAAREAFGYDPRSESFRHASGHVLSLQRITALDISAAAIRAHVAAGRSIGFLVPAAVETYIEAHRLYRPGDVTR